MELLESDAPIRRPDDDVLARFPMVKWLTAKILEYLDPEKPCGSVAIGINGAWGSGKTSFLNLIQHELDAVGGNTPIVFRFEPWMVHGQEQLVSVFLSQLAAVLGRDGATEKMATVSQALQAFSSALAFVRFAPVVGDVASFVSKITKEGGDTLSSFAKMQEQDLGALKTRVCHELKSSKQGVVVMIDDIDRLGSTEIVDVVRLVRAVADFPNTVYLLAFDRLVVEAALSGFQEGSQVSYIDKLLQLTIDLPEPSRGITHGYAYEYIREIIKSVPLSEGEQYRWDQFRFGILPELFASLRDAKRFVNSLRFSNGVIGGEVSVVDQICLEVVRQRKPELFRRISDTMHLWVSDELDSGNDKQQTEGIKRLLDGFADTIIDIMKLIFPPVNSAYPSPMTDWSYRPEWRYDRRVCVAPYFVRYFQGMLPGDHASRAETDRVLTAIDDQRKLSGVLSRLATENRLAEALELLRPEIARIAASDPERISPYIAAACDAGEHLPDGYTNQSGLPIDWFITRPLYDAVSKVTPAVRTQIVVKAIAATTEAIFFPLDLVVRLMADHDKGSRRPEALIPEDDVPVLRESVALIVARGKDDLQFLDTYQPFKAFWNWSRIYDWNDTEIKNWLEKSVLQDDRNLPRFLRSFGQYLSSSTLGDAFSRIRYEINPDTVGQFTDISELRLRCKKLLEERPEWLEERDRQTLLVFLETEVSAIG